MCLRAFLRMAIVTVIASTQLSTAGCSAKKSTPPAPVKPFVVTGTTPSERARDVVAAFAVKDFSTRAGAVVAALSSIGVPTVGLDGMHDPNTDSDGLGLPWIVVARAGTTSPVASASLEDVVKSFDQPLLKPRPTSSNEADQFLGQLRLALTEGSERVEFFARTIQLTSLRLGGKDIADPATRAAEVRLDAPTMTLLYGRYLRTLLLQVASMKKMSSSPPPNGSIVRVSYLVAAQASMPKPTQPTPNPAPPPVFDCSSDGVNGWGMWLASKAFAGVDLTGTLDREIEGLMQVVLRRAASAPGGVNAEMLKAGKGAVKVGAYVSTMLTLMNLAYELSRTTADATLQGGEPLIRHKKRSQGDGEAKVIVVTARLQGIQDGDQTALDALNCLSLIAMLGGNNTTFPKPGPLPGIDLRVIGKQGFTNNLVTAGTLVLFGPEEVRLDQTTDAGGRIRIGVQGRRQTSDASEKAKPVEKHFSIAIEGRLEPMDGQSLGRTMLDDLLCTFGGKAAGCADAFADTLKGFHWNFGEFQFRLTDWSRGWVINEEAQIGELHVHAYAKSCEGPDGPWTIVRNIKWPEFTTSVISAPFTLQNGIAKKVVKWASSTGGSMKCNSTIEFDAAMVPLEGGYLLTMRTVKEFNQTCIIDGHVGTNTVTSRFGDAGIIEYQVKPATEADCGEVGIR